MIVTMATERLESLEQVRVFVEGLDFVGSDRSSRNDFVRVDSVHQGDLDGRKGVHEINLVDEVTQYEFVGAVEVISERFLIPVLEGLLDLFPFVIKGFHADNGSEYVNRKVAASTRRTASPPPSPLSAVARPSEDLLFESANGIIAHHLNQFPTRPQARNIALRSGSFRYWN